MKSAHALDTRPTPVGVDLREIALREVAQEVGHKRLTTVEPVSSRVETIAADAPQAVGERLLALIEPYPGAQRLILRAWRSSQRLGAEVDPDRSHRPATDQP